MTGPWLGDRRGHLSDWITQQWVGWTGRRVDLAEEPWLDGPTGSPRGIGRDYYRRLAERRGLAVRDGEGLMGSFADLAGPAFDPGAVDPRIVHFYEHTSRYRLDAWSHWRGPFRPFGWLVARIFSRRLEQLNLPLSPLDTSRGLDSRIVELVDPATGTVRHTGWVRVMPSSDRVVYVGDYSLCRPPGEPGPCVKVVFPLPNGNATVVLRPEAGPDGDLRLVSRGERFGDAGFYFVVRPRGSTEARVRFLASHHERLHVFVDDDELHTDHDFELWGRRYLELHYRLTPTENDRTRARNRERPGPDG